MLSRLTRSVLAIGALALFTTGCAAVSDEDEILPGLPAGEIEAEGTSLETIFAAASSEFDVPASLLKAIAWTETGWQFVDGHEEFEGKQAAYGIMGLRGASLEQGAALAGVSVEQAQTETEPNVRAAAAMLDVWATEMQIERADLGAWAPVAATYSGIEDAMGQAFYVHREIFNIIKQGIITEGAILPPNTSVVPKFPLFDASSNPGPDYAEAIYRPSPNWSYRPSGTSGDPQMVIIHTCEGSYSGCWSWLANSSSGVSAHYVVNNTGSEVSQLVPEARKAWHIAAKYDCSNNSGKSCGLNNVSSNNFTVGIEHAGYASQSSWSSGLINTSAKLTCDITKDNAIPRDKYHIVGHGQLQPYNRVDPGPNWPWSQYINLVNSYCGQGPDPEPSPDPQPDPDPNPNPNPTPGSLDVVVDSNNAANGGNAECQVSGNWTASNNVAGYYNSGYWWRTTGSSSDLANFKVYLDGAKKVQIKAWWPAAADRSTNAPWLIYNGSGAHIDTVFTNQQQNGGKWVTLGTYNLTAGWNTVALSRWTSASGVVVADAVRFTEVP